MEKEIKHKVLFDGRNLFEVKELNNLGYFYESIGRSKNYFNIKGNLNMKI
jgi:UDPglucose 6-dehydrogenase